MGAEVVLVKQLLLVVLLVLLPEVVDPFGLSVTAHVLGEVSVGAGFLFEVGSEGPGQDGILRNIVIVPACNLVEPLQVLVVGHLFVDPLHGLARVDVVRERIFLYLDVLLNDGEEGVHVPQVEVEQHFLPVFRLYVNRIVGGVESFLIDFPDIA